MTEHLEYIPECYSEVSFRDAFVEARYFFKIF